MQALVVYCHPSPESFNAAVLKVVMDRLEARGAQVTLVDLYAEGFDPSLSREDWDAYLEGPCPSSTAARHCAAVRAADTLIFVYPTWWYGMPGMLKGWLDRVLLPGVAFHLPPDGPITPGMTNIERLGVFTTCGASWLLTTYIGSPGRRTILRGIGLLCKRRVRKAFAAHYSMDTSTAKSRAAHLERVARRMDRLLAGGSDSPALTPVSEKG